LALAERLYRSSIAIHVRLFGQRHIEVATTRNNLALLLETCGRRSEAARVARLAFDAFRASVGSRHPSTRICARNLARLGRPA
jgi:hypothetical protein